MVGVLAAAVFVMTRSVRYSNSNRNTCLKGSACSLRYMGFIYITADSPDRHALDVRPDVAEALVDGIQRKVGVDPPRHATTVEELNRVVAETSQIITHLEAFRELAIVAADASHPHADRKAIAIAAGMPPSRLYRILERHGRPRKRAAE